MTVISILLSVMIPLMTALEVCNSTQLRPVQLQTSEPIRITRGIITQITQLTMLLSMVIKRLDVMP